MVMRKQYWTVQIFYHKRPRQGHCLELDYDNKTIAIQHAVSWRELGYTNDRRDRRTSRANEARTKGEISMSDNNVIDVADRFKAKQEEVKTEKQVSEVVDNFVTAYDEVTDIADLALQAAWTILVSRGIKPTEVNPKDYILFREAMYSMLLGERNILHPLQVTAEDFYEMVT